MVLEPSINLVSAPFVRTVPNATPWMESIGGALRLDPGPSWTAPEIRAMAFAKERNSSDVPQPRGRWRQSHPQARFRAHQTQTRPCRPHAQGHTARNSVGRVGRVRFSRGPRIAECVEVCPARIRRVTGRCAGEGVRGIHQQVPEPVGLEKERAKEQEMLDAPQHG